MKKALHKVAQKATKSLPKPRFIKTLKENEFPEITGKNH